MSPRCGLNPLGMLILAAVIVASVGPAAHFAGGHPVEWPEFKCQEAGCDFSVSADLLQMDAEYESDDSKDYNVFKCPKCKKFTVVEVDHRAEEAWGPDSASMSDGPETSTSDETRALWRTIVSVAFVLAFVVYCVGRISAGRRKK